MTEQVVAVLRDAQWLLLRKDSDATIEQLAAHRKPVAKLVFSQRRAFRVHCAREVVDQQIHHAEQGLVCREETRHKAHTKHTHMYHKT